jgi:hypothetical protein
MTEAVTIDIDGVEFDADDMEAAIEEFSDEYDDINVDEGGVGVHETVAIRGDNYADGDFHAANVADVTSLSGDGGMEVEDQSDIVWTDVRRVRQAIEEARGNVFDPTEYVEDIVAGANDRVVEVGIDSYISSSEGDVEVQYEGTVFGEGEMGDLQADDATTIGKVKYQDGTMHLGVYVDEDEAESEEEGLGELFG